MEHQPTADAHPLLPLDSNGAYIHSRPSRISEEVSPVSLSDPNHAHYLSPRSSQGADHHDLHSRAQQWTQEGHLERQSEPPQYPNNSEPTHQTGQNTGLRPDETFVPISTNTLRENGPNFHPAHLERSIKIEEAEHGRNPGDQIKNLAKARRQNTFFEEAPTEERLSHKYFVRRPRALQVEHEGHFLDVGDDGKLDLEHPESHYGANKEEELEGGEGATGNNEKAKLHHPDSHKKQRGMFTHAVHE